MSELKRCYGCRRIIWGIENEIRVKDRAEPVTVCTECRQVLELMGRVERSEDGSRRKEEKGSVEERGQGQDPGEPPKAEA